MHQTIGFKLKALRVTHSVSQKIVADHLGISVPAYSKIETGLSDINYEKIVQIAHLYGISIVDLIKIGESSASEHQYPDLKKQLDDLSFKYNEQQKKMIDLYEIIREQKSALTKI